MIVYGPMQIVQIADFARLLANFHRAPDRVMDRVTDSVTEIATNRVNARVTDKVTDGQRSLNSVADSRLKTYIILCPVLGFFVKPEFSLQIMGNRDGVKVAFFLPQ